MERLCRACFEKQYAVVSAGKKGIHAQQFLVPALAIGIFGIIFLLNLYFPSPMANVGHTMDLLLRVAKVVLAGAAVVWSIWDSLRWRSAQNLLFWVVVALNLAAFVFWSLRDEWRWFFLLVATFFLNKAMAAFHERRAA